MTNIPFSYKAQGALQKHNTGTNYRMPLLKLSWSRQLSRNIPADADFSCDKVPVLGDEIKGTYFVN
jgi:hypothetical protein